MKNLHQKKVGRRKPAEDIISPVTAKAAFEAWQDRKGMPRDVKRKPYFKTKKP